ncbi:TniQ family protein [Duganella sp. HH101]|uniref:TniQ family protein n=1 Tax=Duganella sp. HH101 TaxID=1781066 RepID=UPI0008938006|nr:TniQ family protein [Duganella sp. HH101]OFA05641.1 hypothetical protein DUGA2_12200 [Duganella sp. HH101]
MSNLPSKLWPVRDRPLPDELLSSWLVRLAHLHGLKAQSFCHLVFGNEHQVWNRDIDRLAPAWLIEGLSTGTGVSMSTALDSTLRVYEGLFYPKFRTAGNLPWVLTQQMYHRKRNGFGLQFCPQCLKEDTVPYFRKRWRIAVNTTCQLHGCHLLDRCPACGHAIAVHRLDMGNGALPESAPLSQCFACGVNLALAITSPIYGYAKDASQLLARIEQKLEAGTVQWTRVEIEELAVLRHLTGLMTARYQHDYLREYVADQLRVKDIILDPKGLSVEARPWEERRHLIQLAAWLLADIDYRLTNAWKAGSIRYNLLLKGLDSPPAWYVKIVKPLSNWRDR